MEPWIGLIGAAALLFVVVWRLGRGAARSDFERESPTPAELSTDSADPNDVGSESESSEEPGIKKDPVRDWKGDGTRVEGDLDALVETMENPLGTPIRVSIDLGDSGVLLLVPDLSSDAGRQSVWSLEFSGMVDRVDLFSGSSVEVANEVYRLARVVLSLHGSGGLKFSLGTMDQWILPDRLQEVAKARGWGIDDAGKSELVAEEPPPFRPRASANERPAPAAPREVQLPPLPPMPARKFVRDWREMEEAARDWLIYMGFADARITGGSADGGVDVEGSHVVAQVKDEGRKTKPNVVREIRGVAAGKEAACFSRAGYTDIALREGQKLGVALFEFDLSAQVVAANSVAENWLTERKRRTRHSLPFL